MSQSDFDHKDTEEAPLDPEMAKVQMKLRRLLAGSSLVMVLGFVAVFAAIFYKINYSEQARPSGLLPQTIAIGENTQVESVQFADDAILVFARRNGTSVLLKIDPSNGQVLSTTEFIAR